MLQKITTLLLLIIFTNVYAFTPKGELDPIFNSLNYSLNVEWDQKDTIFFN